MEIRTGERPVREDFLYELKPPAYGLTAYGRRRAWRFLPRLSGTDMPDVDPVARLTAVAAVALALATFASQRLEAWRKRHRVEILVYVRQAWDNGQRLDYPAVTIRNFGRPISIEYLYFDWRDPRPVPANFGWIRVPLRLEAEPPLLPCMLADGDSRLWEFELGASEDAFDRNADRNLDVRAVRAKARLSNGKVIHSDDFYVLLRRYPPPQ